MQELNEEKHHLRSLNIIKELMNHEAIRLVNSIFKIVAILPAARFKTD